MEPLKPDRRVSRWGWLFAFAWFLGWHLWHTRSVWEDPLHRVPGPLGDNSVMLWNLGWVDHAFRHGSPGFWFQNAYFPEGFLFLYGTHTWLDGFFRWLFSPLLPLGYEGSILWANLTMAGSTVMSGMLVIAGLKAWGIRGWPLLILAASGVVFSWFRMFALTGHYHFYGTQWMLGALVFLSYGRLYALQGKGRLSGWLCVGGGMALGLSFLNDQTMAVYAGIMGLLIWGGLLGRKGFAGGGLRYLGAGAVVSSLHWIPMLLAWVNGKFHYSVDRETPRLVDASSLILPPDMHGFGGVLAPYRQANGLVWAEGTYLGIVPLALFMIGTLAALKYLLSKDKKDIPHLRTCFFAMLIAGVLLIIALGDALVIGNVRYGFLPGRLLRWVPVLDNIRLPQRWVWPAHLCIAVGGCLGVMHWMGMGNKKYAGWMLLVFALIPPLEGQSFPRIAPVDFKRNEMVRQEGLIRAVKKDYSSGSVLTMPVEAAYAHGNLLQFQWGYDIPLAVAYTARMPFRMDELPWQENTWNEETARWLKDRQVSIVVFPFHEAPLREYKDWLQHARQTIPDVKIYDRRGNSVTPD